MTTSDQPSIKSLKVYIPAKNFEVSKRFYTALGFSPTPAFGGTVDFERGGWSFRLQDYYVEDWANNCMFVMGTDDVDGWHQLATDVVSGGEYLDAKVAPIQTIEHWRVLHVKDPSGVLLVFVT